MKPLENGVDAGINHSLFWLMVANAVGFMMALFLWMPDLGSLNSELSYGRWVPVHLNLQLYGWTSLPLVAWLFYSFKSDSISLNKSRDYVVWLWSAALFFGAVNWLRGETSGKIFLDWKGATLLLFITVLFGLWLQLSLSWIKAKGQDKSLVKATGLLALLGVPVGLLVATRPDVFPPVNRDTGGPTGGSLLGSTLVVIALFLILPRALGRLKKQREYLMKWCWVLFIVEFIFFIVIEQQESTHHDLIQTLALGSLIPWCWLLPKLWNQYHWNNEDGLWRKACFLWFLLLVITGWLSFLPGILDRLKFTNGLVAHAHLAMAGFTTSFLMNLISEISQKHKIAALFNRASFWVWSIATLGYILVMWIAGWIEGGNFSWLVNAEVGKDSLYGLRCLFGAGMLSCSVYWWINTVNIEFHEE